MPTSPWPIEIVALNPVSCGSVSWRLNGVLRVTVIVKATFGLVPDGAARLVAPVDVVRRDRHYDKRPGASVEAASDLAPFLPSPGVVVTGHVYAPAGKPVPVMPARLAIVRGKERPLVDKVIHVFGDRALDGPDRPAPFQRMPIRYERAYGGQSVDENPIGTGADLDATRLPNFVAPSDPRKAACFGPIPRSFPARRKLLDPASRAAIDEAVPSLRDGFAFGYFQAAPLDQRLDCIEGDEWLVLEGLHPALPRLRTRLPSARGLARCSPVTSAGAGALQPIDMVADTLSIDSDRQVVCITWRGDLGIEHDGRDLVSLRIFAGVEFPGFTIAWPEASSAGIPIPRIFIDDESTEGAFTAVRRAPPPVEEPEPAPPLSPKASRRQVVIDDEETSQLTADITADELIAKLGSGALPFLGGAAPPPSPSAPDARPSAPVARPSAPVARPSAPDARPSAPVARPSGPLLELDIDDEQTSDLTALLDAPSAASHAHEAAPAMASTVLFDPSRAASHAPEAAPAMASTVLFDPPERTSTAVLSPEAAAALRASVPFEAPPERPSAPKARPPIADEPTMMLPEDGELPGGIENPPTVEGSLEQYGLTPVPFTPAAEAPPPRPSASSAATPWSADDPRKVAPAFDIFAEETAFLDEGSAPEPPSARPLFARPFSFPVDAPPPEAEQAARFFHRVSPPGAEPASSGPKGPSLPKRESELIPIVNGTSFAAATIAWQVKPPRDSITVIVKGTFDLVHGGPAALRPEADWLTGDTHFRGLPDSSLLHASDYAVFKPRADVTLVGHAHAPGGSSRAMQVRFRFGEGSHGFERVLHVFGDRRWSSSVVVAPTEPEPFTRMPLVYERAFGGPRFDDNPIGIGHKGVSGTRLPNLEITSRPIAAPGDTPPPAGLGPIPTLWKARWSKLGTYDQTWFATRWPYFPDDFDWGFYQSAPAAQQLDELRGDEPFDLVGLDPDLPRLTGHLPGVRPRCFVQRTEETGGAFEEVVLRLDTVAFDTDERKVNLVWRGLLDVSDEDAPEIDRLFVTAEEPGEPKLSPADARQRFFAEALPRHDDDPASTDPDDPPTTDDGEIADDPELRRVEAQIAEHRRAVDARLRAAGIPENEIADVPGPLPHLDPNAIASMLRASGAGEAEIAELLAVLEPPTENDTLAPDAELRARVIALLEAGEPLDALDLERADLHDLDFDGRSLAGTVLRNANLSGSSFVGSRLVGAQMSGADLSGAVLRDADLTEADLTGANLERATLERATLDYADLTGVAGASSTFTRAHGRFTILAGARWDSAVFDGVTLESADFSGAFIGGAFFTGAQIPDVRLYEAHGAGAVFDGATMTSARAEGAALTRGSFQGVSARSSVWEKAILDESSFTGADLEGASFLRASCLKTDFSSADLAYARMRRARLGGAVFRRANLRSAVLDRADLTIADLRASNLHSASLLRAKLADARLAGAVLTQSSLARRPS